MIKGPWTRAFRCKTCGTLHKDVKMICWNCGAEGNDPFWSWSESVRARVVWSPLKFWTFTHEFKEKESA